MAPLRLLHRSLLVCAFARLAAAASEPMIAFVARPDGAHDYVHVMYPNGTGVRRVTANAFDEGAPTWRPDGAVLVFEGYEADVGIYLVDLDGGRQRRLSPSPGFDVRPSFSPDGARIIYCRVLDPNAPGVPPTEIRVMDADGSNDHLVLATGPPPGTFNIEPRWGGPDNDTVVFFSNRVPMRQLCFTMKSDGSALRQVTNITCGDPFWSPDGRRISFGSNVEGGGKLNVFAMDPDGANIVQLTHYDVPFESGDTSWSRDGSRIAFEYDEYGSGQSNKSAWAEIRTVNADGSGAEASTHVRCSGVGCSPRFRPGPA